MGVKNLPNIGAYFLKKILIFLRDGTGGLTKADVVDAAARRGLDVATYVKKLIADDIAKEKGQA